VDINIYFEKYKKHIIIISLVILIVLALAIGLLHFRPFLFVNSFNNINIYLKPINANINVVTADSSNRFMLKVEVKNEFGQPVSDVPIVFNVDNNIGIVNLKSTRTDKFGEAVVTYIPPDNIEDFINDIEVSISAKIINKFNIIFNINPEDKLSKYVFKLIPVPVILVHGYQSTSEIFTNMVIYLDSFGFNTIPFNYNSMNGVILASNEFKEFLKGQAHSFYLKGIQLKRFDVVSHSMGGIISRYYSVTKDYIEFNNIRKLIFISTPHKGSHLAPIGAKYFNDEGVKDMMPKSDLFTKLFPQMINKGLNPNIQTGNIIGQFDEVVSIESADLQEWEIDTSIFNIGSSKFNVDNLLDGTISQTAIHKLILNNTKVYETIVSMLTRRLTYPIKIE